MKIINLVTNIVFDLPKKDAEQLLESSPDTFSKVTKNKKNIKNKSNNTTDNSVLNQILEE
jgi:hypothetical protein